MIFFIMVLFITCFRLDTHVPIIAKVTVALDDLYKVKALTLFRLLFGTTRKGEDRIPDRG